MTCSVMYTMLATSAKKMSNKMMRNAICTPVPEPSSESAELVVLIMHLLRAVRATPPRVAVAMRRAVVLVIQLHHAKSVAVAQAIRCDRALLGAAVVRLHVDLIGALLKHGLGR
eukprot:CAMPEP_0205910250 /NCGR_PEP_ID=MMETSP1325-20131115/4332_1 /ASSEMBLY_ACC=CAM_ASM_000708 /TAXON_ID=236786 /ORGANISM="Florenciella sp., Strain RCC1007" /LENGTH=113 /DNA_ID=CAMNT_0053276593 /DNA_START=219 /DNA_END=559 /DNA_ORIENTATION=+